MSTTEHASPLVALRTILEHLPSEGSATVSEVAQRRLTALGCLDQLEAALAVTDERVEAVARALAVENARLFPISRYPKTGFDPDWDRWVFLDQERFREFARVALAVVDGR